MILQVNDHKHEKMIKNQYCVKCITFATYLAVGFNKGCLASAFAFFPYCSPLLYGSVCWDLHFILMCVPITNFVSGHECWLGAIFLTFGRNVGHGKLARIVLRSELSCKRLLVRCMGGAMHMCTASHWIFNDIPASAAEFTTVESQPSCNPTMLLFSSLWDLGLQIHNEVSSTSLTTSGNRC